MHHNVIQLFGRGIQYHHFPRFNIKNLKIPDVLQILNIFDYHAPYPSVNDYLQQVFVGNVRGAFQFPYTKIRGQIDPRRETEQFVGKKLTQKIVDFSMNQIVALSNDGLLEFSRKAFVLVREAKLLNY
jgi:hypothetical protein